MSEENTNKPVVSFGGIAGWVDVGEHGVCAGLTDTRGHPRLGDNHFTRTSYVIGMKRDREFGTITEIETRNTIYRRR